MHKSIIRNSAMALAILAAGVSGASAAEFSFRQSGYSVWNMSEALRGPGRAGAFVFKVEQVMGQRCVTRVGWCPVDPQPVGTECRCGNVEGTPLQ